MHIEMRKKTTTEEELICLSICVEQHKSTTVATTAQSEISAPISA